MKKKMKMFSYLTLGTSYCTLGRAITINQTDSAGGQRVSDKALMGFWLPFILISKPKERKIAEKRSRNLSHVLDCLNVLHIVKYVLVD